MDWVIAGPVSIASGPGKHILHVQVDKSEDDVSHQLLKFWEMNSFGIRVKTIPLYARSDQREMDIL